MCVQGFNGKPERRRTLGKPRHRGKDNIKMNLREVGWGRWMDPSGLDKIMWRSFVNAVMNVRVSWNAGNFLTNWGPVSFSGRTLLLGVSCLLGALTERFPWRRWLVAGFNPGPVRVGLLLISVALKDYLQVFQFSTSQCHSSSSLPSNLIHHRRCVI